MNKGEYQQLKKELSQAGASAAEISELPPVAAHLGLLATAKPAATTPRSGRKKVGPLAYVVVAGAILIATLTIVLLSQLTLPGNPLYPVQKLSDNAAIALRPEYRADVMMKRARQVKLLVDRRAHPDTVLATLEDYQAVASAYRVNASNYEAFEYCKANLEQAAATAPSSERPAIDHTLSSLKDI